MPGMKEPCGVCGGEKRHRRMKDGNPCPQKKRALGLENPEDAMERLRKEVTLLPDGAFAAHYRFVMQEREARVEKIRKARAADLAALGAHEEPAAPDPEPVVATAEPAPPVEAPPPAEPKPETTTLAEYHTKVPAGLPPGVSPTPVEGLRGVVGTCGEKWPVNIAIRCKVETRAGKHHGDHHNPKTGHTWAQKNPPQQAKAS